MTLQYLEQPSAFKFDAWLSSDSAEAKALADRLIITLIGRGRYRNFTVKRKAAIKILLLNLAKAHLIEPGKPVRYPRATEGMPKFYSPKCISAKVLAEAVDGLAALGMVESLPGSWNPNGGLGTQSLVTPTAKLILEFEKGAFDRWRFTRLPGQPLIELRSAKDPFGRWSYVQYPPQGTPTRSTINTMARQLVAFDKFMKQFEVAHPDKRAPVEARGLFRVFNDQVAGRIDLGSGGRFYGAWYQNLSARERARLTINGKPIVELDFSGLHPRMLYHLRGLELQGDPYAAPGMPDGVSRTLVKKTLNAMFNAGGVDYHRLKFIGELDGERVPDGLKLGDVMAALIEHHDTISDEFGTGVGLRLQKIDSRICEDIINWAMESNIPILPVHDSFITWEDKEEELREAMTLAYERHANGFIPIIDRK